MRIADMARPFLSIEAEFAAQLRVKMRRHMVCISDAELSEMAEAIMTLARVGVGSGTRQ